MSIQRYAFLATFAIIIAIAYIGSDSAAWKVLLACVGAVFISEVFD
jgi:hypothetical protein